VRGVVLCASVILCLMGSLVPNTMQKHPADVRVLQILSAPGLVLLGPHLLRGALLLLLLLFKLHIHFRKGILYPNRGWVFVCERWDSWEVLTQGRGHGTRCCNVGAVSPRPSIHASAH
jgi:hypothetical protein